MKHTAKLLLLSAILLTLLIPLGACTSKEPIIASESPSISSEPSLTVPSPSPDASSMEPLQTEEPSAAPSPETTVDPSTTPSTKPSTKPSPSPSGKDYLDLGFAILEKDGLGSIKLGISESTLIDLMGEPDTKAEAELWGADGLEHANWSYTTLGFDVDMVKPTDGGEAAVNSISAYPPCALATSRGIKLGDTKEAVLGAYKNEIDPAANDDTDTWIIIGSIYGGMGIGIDNGLVTFIFIGASAE